MCIGSGIEQHVPRLVLCGITVAAQVVSDLPHCHGDNDGCGMQLESKNSLNQEGL